MTSPPDGASDTPPVNVLMVDDEPANLLALEVVLHDFGQNLVGAASGEEALRRLLRDDFAVVLLDVRMGGLDGFETARLIRGRERSRHTPIIFLTANPGSEFPAERAYELGAVDYLVKPLVPVVLRAKVAGFVELFRRGERLRRLERRAAERQAAEQALRARAEALAEADRRKDQFLAMLAHELRNPLAPLASGIQVARLAGADAGARDQALALMERQVRLLSRLVDDLLDVSRIVRGKVQIRRERLDMARLVRVTAEDRRRTLEQAGLMLKTDTPETPVWVNGDATRLAQVLNNLLDNAAKFTERGGRVAVRLTADECLREAVLVVADTGVGVEQEMLGSLWDVFAQADRSLDRSKGGLGLGLSVVKGLVELHGGRVEAASGGLGRGAEFSVRFPMEREPAPLLAVPDAPRPAGRRIKVLIVEDGRDAADSLKLLLDLLGHETRVAYTGPDGVGAAKEWTPDVVLCDIGLPGLDGYGVARELRLHPTTARVRLVALTGYGGEEDRSRSRQAGFDAHLTKPVAPQALMGQLAPPG